MAKDNGGCAVYEFSKGTKKISALLNNFPFKWQRGDNKMDTPCNLKMKWYKDKKLVEA